MINNYNYITLGNTTNYNSLALTFRYIITAEWSIDNGNNSNNVLLLLGPNVIEYTTQVIYLRVVLLHSF